MPVLSTKVKNDVFTLLHGPNFTLDANGIIRSRGIVQTKSDFSVQGVTLVDIPYLSIPLQAGGSYFFQAVLYNNLVSNAGEASTVYFQGFTPSYAIFSVVVEDSSNRDASNWSTTLGTPFTDNITGASAGPVILKLTGMLSTGNHNGNLTIRYAQETGQSSPQCC